mgnify:CR=1 FL=1
MIEIEKPRIDCEQLAEDGSYGKFVVEPLERGYGTTLGNSLRRILLSSLPGTAASSIKIAGVQHEFSTIPGVKEDVTEIVLNVKGIIAKLHCDGPKTVYIEAAGEGEVKAGDIHADGEVEILNPDLHIATLAEDGELEIEFTVERGRGYVPAQMNKQDGDEIGRIPVDSIYSPVLKVSYKVEATRVEQRTDFDKLILDVETKPAISPRDAVASAGSTLVELFGLCRELNTQAEGVEIGPAPVAEQADPGMSVPIEDLNLTQRSYNCLKREGIHTIGELVAHTEQDLLDIRNFGMKSIDEVKEKLQSLGLALKASPLGNFDTNNLEGGTFFSPEDE